MHEAGRSVRALAVVLAAAVLAVAGCDGEPDALRPCAGDDECRSGEACLEGLCAVALDDPGGEGPPARGPVRVFAVGLHLDMADVETQESFRQAVRAVVDEEVVPHLAEDRPSLLVFPEDTGLFAGLIGLRGEEARASGSMAQAFLDLSISYDEAAGFYSDRATRSLGPGGLVSLSVTDTLWRSVELTFVELAREHGVWIAVTYNVADAEETEDPDLVRILVDEGEPDRTAAWVAIGDDVHNQTLVIDPDGEIVGRHRKEYLVIAEESSLNLAYGPVGGLRAEPTPFGPIGVVISKDAWMPDVLDRLALEGAAMMLQPEAFSGWGVPHGEHGDWAPDVVKESGWSHVMRFAEFRVNLLSCLSANLFEMYFDCQSSILVQPDIDASLGAFIGQDPDVGFARVAPWVAEDDGVGSLEDRRARLVEVGERLLPGSGAPDENGYVSHTVWMDLDLSAPYPEVGDAGGLTVAPSEAGEQRRPDVVALDDGTLFVLWEDDRRGQTRLYGARVADAGAGLEPGEARVRIETSAQVRAPRVAARGQVVHAVWQERTGGEEEAGAWVVRHARSRDGGRSFGEPTTVSPFAGADQWLPDLTVDEDGEAHVVWVDGREGPLRIYSARSRDGGRGSFEEAVAVEPPSDDEGYDTRLNRWSPTVAARGDVVAVAWGDHRSYRWEIWGAVSDDGGRSFSEAVRLDDADVPFETIHMDPESTFSDEGDWLLAWTDLRERRPNYDVRLRRLRPEDLADAPPSLSLATTDDSARPQWRPSVAASSGEVLVIWQDFRRDRNELRLARSSDGGASFEPDVPLEGADLEGAQQHGPRVVGLPGGGFAAVWESTASGSRRARVGRVP